MKPGQQAAAPVMRHISVQLTPEEVVDLRMLQNDLQHRPGELWRMEKRFDIDRYLRVVDKILAGLSKPASPLFKR
jgi:hypothetical protein